MKTTRQGIQQNKTQEVSKAQKQTNTRPQWDKNNPKLLISTWVPKHPQYTDEMKQSSDDIIGGGSMKDGWHVPRDIYINWESNPTILNPPVKWSKLNFRWRYISVTIMTL